MSNDFLCLVADPFGRVLEEIRPESGTIGSILNGVGATSITMKTRNSKFVESNFLFGGMIYFAFGNGLLPWAGFAVRRKWRAPGLAEIEYRSAEILFGWRVSGKDDYFQNTPGLIARQALVNASASFPANIIPLDIWNGGTPLVRDYHFENLADVLADVQEASAGDWNVDANETGGRIKLYLNFYERRGSDKAALYLKQGVNIEIPDYTEQDTGLVNQWYVVGGGNTWDDDRPVGFAQDMDSIAVHGLRQDVVFLNGVTDIQSLNAHAASLLSKSLIPFRSVGGVAVDKEPARFADYDVGDRLTVEAPQMGFGGISELGRVTGRDFDLKTGQATLSLELDTLTYGGTA